MYLLKRLDTPKAWFLIFLSVFFYRLILCSYLPLSSSDLFRNLGFSSHLFDSNIHIYSSLAKDFYPEKWTVWWPETGYTYPPFTLLMFATFSYFKLGFFFVKLLFTLSDLIVSLIFFRTFSKSLGILYFICPYLIYYSSVEGQFETIQVLFIVLNIMFHKKKNWLLSGLSFGLGFHVKYLNVLLIPWLLYEIYKNKGSLKPFISGLVISIIPFLGFYINSPSFILTPLKLLGFHYNGYAWFLSETNGFVNFFNTRNFHPPLKYLVYWNSIITTIICLLLTSSIIIRGYKNKSILSQIPKLPLLTYLFMIKTIAYTQPWYVVISQGFVYLAFKRKNTFFYLILVLFFLVEAQGNFLLFDAIIGREDNYYKDLKDQFMHCQYFCSY